MIDRTLVRPLGDDPPSARLIYGQDVLESLTLLPDQSVQMVATSPPYYGLRNYNRDGQIGLEQTPAEYIDRLVAVFREVHRVLRDDGTVWLNLGDSYATPLKGIGGDSSFSGGGEKRKNNRSQPQMGKPVKQSYGDLPIKPKDLMGIPWRVAFALQADGWYLRQDIVWCLLGTTQLYARTQKGDMPMSIKDMYRLDPQTVQLWNGQRWTQLRGISRSLAKGDEIQLLLRSGERISCTPNHQWPTSRGLLDARDIRIGDTLTATTLPEPETLKDCALDEDAAWFAGLYLAEGSRSEDTIQLAGHALETARWERVQRIAKKFGGSATVTVTHNSQHIRVYGKVLNAILDEFVSGKVAHNKGFAPVVWRYSNSFLASMLEGYLSGDGSRDPKNPRWRIGFCRNYKLERDLRVVCARLGYTLTLKPSHTKYQGEKVPTFRGEIRLMRSGHHNEKDRCEVVGIKRAKCHWVYDLGVEDDPHLFALASGVLSHNSKPNPMPSSVTDRCTTAHEYVFLLSKSPRYFYDQDPLREVNVTADRVGERRSYKPGGASSYTLEGGHEKQEGSFAGLPLNPMGRNCRSVWTIPTKPYPGAHFATWPEKLVERMILAGSSEKGCCAQCHAPWVRVVEKETYRDLAETRPMNKTPLNVVRAGWREGGPTRATVGWEPSCDCNSEAVVPCVVMDIFSGSGTTGFVALQHGRDYIGLDLNDDYLPLAEGRIQGETGGPAVTESNPLDDIFG